MVAMRGWSALANDAPPGSLDRLGITPRSSLFLAVDPDGFRVRQLPDVGAQRVVVRLPGQKTIKYVLQAEGGGNALSMEGEGNVCGGPMREAASRRGQI